MSDRINRRYLNKKKKKANTSPVGRRGKVLFGLNFLPVVVVEDRGWIGSRGRRIFRVRVDDVEENTDQTFEIPADEFVLAES